MQKRHNSKRNKWSRNDLAKRRRLMVERGISADDAVVKEYEDFLAGQKQSK